MWTIAKVSASEAYEIWRDIMDSSRAKNPKVAAESDEELRKVIDASMEKWGPGAWKLVDVVDVEVWD